MEKTAMRYCYTETEKAPVSLEISAADLREIRKAVDAAATADGSSYRLRRISEDLRRVLREVAEQIQRQRPRHGKRRRRGGSVMRVEITAIAADEAPVQPIADRLRFRLEFALLLLAAGRIEEAGAEFDRVFELIDALDA
jgi:hypothetical protein